MTISKISKVVSIALFAFATSAHAELQTWRLTSTTYGIQDGFAPPPFATIGSHFYIDYVIDSSEPSLSGWDGTFSGAVKSFTINGTTSQAEGYISAHGGLNAINISPSSSRNDGIDFISFNNFSGTYNANVTSALNEFSVSAQTPSTDLRVDFGNTSIWAKPSSFAMTSVPEPTSILLFVLGLPLVFLRKHRQHIVA